MIMSDRDVAALPEYSCSIPTGTTIGKRWVRYDGSHHVVDRAGRFLPAYPRYLGEYAAHPTDETKVRILWCPLLTESELAALLDVVFWWLP
jgi:hypothetical protein